MAKEPLFNSTDTQTLDKLRSSPLFPALVGGLAGAAISVVVMLAANRTAKPKKNQPAAYDADGNAMNVVYLPAPKEPRLLGFTIGDLLTLGMTGLSMFRQMQDMRNGTSADGLSVPSQTKVSHKK